MQSKQSLTMSAITLLALLAITVSGIALSKTSRKGNTEKSDLANSLDKIIASKKLNVCVAEWPPFSIKDAKTGSYTGVDIDAIKLVAKEINAEVIFHDTTFGNMPAAIQSGICDLSTSFYVTPSRSAAVDFTRPILFGGDAALIRKGAKRFNTITDFDQAGIKIATATGESGDIYVKDTFTKATIVSIDVDSSDQTRFLLEVTSGRADVGIADYNTIANFAKVHPETEILFQNNPFNLSPDAYSVRQGDMKLLNFLNNSILSMQSNGTWEAIEKKYGATAFHDQMNIK